MAGLNAAKSLDTLLEVQNLHLVDDKDKIWLSTFDFLREVQMKKPLFPLSKSRAKLLGDHFFALDLDIQKANEELRKVDSLSYDQLKALSWAQDFTRLTFRSSGSDQLTGVLKTRDEDLQGWEVVAHHLGQEIIDSINANLFQAIVANDFDALIKAIEKGALINANDRFGHTPLHFTAYKGNARFLNIFCKTEAIRTQEGDMTRPLFIVRHGKKTPRPWKFFWRKARMSTPEPTKGKPPA